MKKITLGAVFIFIALSLYSLVDIISSSSGQKEPVHTSEITEDVNETVVQPEQSEQSDTNSVLSVEEKKRRFIQTILPVVRDVKRELDADYAKVKRLTAKHKRSPEEDAWLAEQMAKYRVEGVPCLLRRMHTHPVSLVIAQAALETGWGSSRFFNEANNVFGIWSYHKNEPRIPAGQQRGQKTIYVKKYASLYDGIRGYFRMISSGYAYSSFRKARMQTANPFELLRYLRHYSELRDEYVARLYYVIKTNRLYTYDAPSFEPKALASILPEYVAQKRRSQARQMTALNEVKCESEPTDENHTLPCEDEEVSMDADPQTLLSPEM